MILLYFTAGAIFGIAITTIFLGKELYRFYMKSSLQKNEIERLSKLNRMINKLKDNVDTTLS